MRNRVRILLLLLALFTAGYPVNAQNSFRIQRPVNAPSAGRLIPKLDETTPQATTTVKVTPAFPLSIDHSEYQGDVTDQTHMSGVDRTGLQGRNDDQAPWSLNSQRSQIQVGASDQAPFNLNSGRQRDLSQRELALLGTHDVCVIMDKSFSMGTRDCPSTSGDNWLTMLPISRWRWTFGQLHDLTRQMSRMPSKGITLVLFDKNYWVHHNVNLAQLPEIFDNYHPWNGTHLAPPLEDQFEEYFRRRAMGSVRPLLIAIITDGRPHDEEVLVPTIVQAVNRLRNPNEITITILQVGNDPKGQWFTEMLDRGLGGYGAKYHIVHTQTFPELQQSGLSRALLQAVDARRVIGAQPRAR